MARLVAAFFIIILLVIFASQNLDPIMVRFVFGSAVNVPLIIVIIGAFVAGYALALFSFIIRLSKRNRNKRFLPPT